MSNSINSIGCKYCTTIIDSKILKQPMYIGECGDTCDTCHMFVCSKCESNNRFFQLINNDYPSLIKDTKYCKSCITAKDIMKLFQLMQECEEEVQMY
jgi:hypothetical protein